ncbi:MCE family protein [Pseudonocardia sp. RS11V-5]|uniref:MlaD family protein n=1 Tax=Pseudonocardia terrae TaxID=2905831 RepID=UPI001E2D8E99|nr:MlaD family protein [Pseudonocardia terrae]MCE3552852.1 MCE family protein [Pseudonocardia terrae]
MAAPQTRPVVPIVAGVLALLLVAGLVLAFSGGGRYTVTAVMPAGNPNLIEGAPVYIDGFEAGSIETIEPENNQAVITVSLDRDLAPLHAGAFFHVQWKALVGERLLFIEDGPKENAEIPSGGMVEGDFPKPTEVADILAALDPATREKLGSLTETLQTTVKGHEQDLNGTLQTAGPALAAVGEVLRGIGTDGPAINALVTDLNSTMATIANRQDALSGVVTDLSTSSKAMAAQREQLRAALQKLPSTLDIAQGTLGRVPGVTEETLPLLSDLESATAKLPGVSEQLAPLLADLRPLVADLKPTLESASLLLDRTPGLLDSAHGALPGLSTAADAYTPALDFLRPYTPDVTSFLTNWGGAGQNYDSNGRYMRIFAQEGTTSPDVNPGVTPPGIQHEDAPAPFSALDTAGNGPVDAGGEGPR